MNASYGAHDFRFINRPCKKPLKKTSRLSLWSHRWWPKNLVGGYVWSIKIFSATLFGRKSPKNLVFCKLRKGRVQCVSMFGCFPASFPLCTISAKRRWNRTPTHRSFLSAIHGKKTDNSSSNLLLLEREGGFRPFYYDQAEKCEVFLSCEERRIQEVSC